ncbi:outer membrane protein assembly factor BamD [Oceanicella actignis]|uniref:Outer membrane protein assembly factor BamD n=1 Tax=Oceanicella actignis TaxID=1189325 RepID=A0A1M7SAU0_9RHOB|nr:outer membrane protein assembly factor BamD [Oceanicella actignis]SET28741.1 Beta-barrel assembly machine subunit BamD [Oceanicella actignis]SHN55606.1 outer membrane protein assembly factor BamD [Oceanicella actignis]
MPRFALIAAAILALSACSSGGDKDPFADPYAGRSAASIYQEAEAQLNDGDPVKAGETFEELERVHPYSEWARRAMIMAAFAYYQGAEFDRAIAAAQRFLDFFPSDPDSPYAQYLIGMSWYDRILDVKRDQRAARMALQELEEVVRRYPDSEYAREAQLKIDLTRDQLAGQEMLVGRYYLGQGNYIAAINRFKVVLTRYQTTSHTPEALHRLVEAYLALGVEDEARTAAAVLGYNFPGSDWYQASYALLQGADIAPFENRESWISRAFRRVVTGSTL